jgi:OmcA/MtrC family decaheme c-type cytochrome
MKRTLIRLGLTALVASTLFGCGGGSDGVDGATVTVPINVSNKQTVATNTATPSSASVAAWRALEPKVTVTGVTIASPPVVRFAVTDAAGNAVVGLGNTSKAATATVSSLTNLSFTLAKLVPATASAPSKWVSYLVVKPLTVAQAAGTIAITESCTADKKWCGTYPTTDKEGSLVDNGDGTYKYTFARDITQMASIVGSLPASTDTLKKKEDLGDLGYNPGLTHRLGIVISGAAPGTGTNVPSGTLVVPATNIAIAGNAVYDFRPDGGAVTSTRDVVDIASCSSCHNGKGLAHGGSRKDPKLCATCHTDQVKYGMSAEASRTGLALTGTTQNTTSVLDGHAIGNFPNLVHKVHMGAELKLSGYNYIPNASGVGMNFKEVEWIQDPRNCTKCHNGADKTDINQATKTKDGDNWKTQPSRLACASCHDNISFAAAGAIPAGLVAHPGGPASDDSSCQSCHSGAGATNPIDVAHRTEVPTANNPVQISGISAISYEIKSGGVTVDATTKQPKITFRIKKDGSYVTAFATPTPTQNAAGVYSVPSTFEPIAGLRGGPTFYIAFAVPQDGVTAPADFNTYASVSLANLLVASGHPKAGTLSAADADGYMTATLTGSAGQLVSTTATTPLACPNVAASVAAGYCANPSLIKIPTTAKLVTGSIIGNFTQVAFTSGDTAKLTAQYNPSTGTVSKGLVIKSPLKKLVAAGYTARRVVVDTDKCESCHEQLGTAVDFHGGARNDGTSCAICHNTSRTSGGWSANASTFVHGIHAGTDPASVTAAKTTGIAVVGNPGKGSGGAGTAYSAGKRTIPFSWHRDALPTATGGFNAAAVAYPGILKTCDNCHVPNAVNFGAAGATLLPNLLWSTSATGKYNGATDTFKVLPRDPTTGLIVADYITADNVVNYGNVFSFVPEGSVVPKVTTSAGASNANALTVAGAGGVTISADGATKVESPVTAACFACHDSKLAQAHMKGYDGVIYGVRSASIGAKTETCLVCHGQGRDQDAAIVHAK